MGLGVETVVMTNPAAWRTAGKVIIPERLSGC